MRDSLLPAVSSFCSGLSPVRPIFAETKNQWARDDPAFVVITSVLVAVASAAYCVAYAPLPSHPVLAHAAVPYLQSLPMLRTPRPTPTAVPPAAPGRFGDTFFRSVLTILSAVVVDFLLLGCVLATSGWWDHSAPLRTRCLQQQPATGALAPLDQACSTGARQALVQPVSSGDGDAQPRG